MIPFARILNYGNVAPEPEKVKKIDSSPLHVGVLYQNGNFYLRGQGADYKLGTGDTNNVFSSWVKCPYSVSDFWLSNACSLIRTVDNKMFYCGNWQFIGQIGGVYQTWTDVSSVFSSIDTLDIKDVKFEGEGTFYRTSLILLNNGNLYGLGHNGNNILGFSGVVSTPTMLTGSVTSIDSNPLQGNFHYIRNGKYYRSGINTAYQLGTGNKTNLSSFNVYDSTGTVLAVRAVNYITMLLIQESTGEINLYYSGTNSSYGFGTGDTDTTSSYSIFTKVTLPFSIDANTLHPNESTFISCVKGSDGTYYTAAGNNFGSGLGRSGDFSIRVNRALFGAIEFEDSSVIPTDVSTLCVQGSSGISYVKIGSDIYWSGSKAYFTEQATGTGDVQQKYVKLELPE